MADYIEPPVSHPSVIHRDDLIDIPLGLLKKINEWAIDHLAIALGSSFGVWLAFIVPLMAFEIPVLLKILGLVSSYWVQLWALFVLQNAAKKSAVADKAKADADHMAQTHMALMTDDTNARVRAIADKLEVT
jgi:hypothetical protein